MKKGTVIAIDDNKSILETIEQSLKYEFSKVIGVSNPELIPSLLQKQQVDVVLLDMNFKAGINTGNEGLFWLKKLKEINPYVEVIMITAFAEIKLAVKAMKQGAFNFVSKPWDIDDLIDMISEALDKKNNSQSPNEIKSIENEIANPIGESQSFKKVLEESKLVAATDASVFIGGENGTGKNILASYIHAHSLRKAKPFVSIDLGSLHENLFESELFGHEKGAFTGAENLRKGKISLAESGTLFFDEIGNLSLSLQAKILTLLQTQTYSAVGSNETVKCDVRFIFASNKNIPEAIQNGNFREDLWYRMNTVELEMPPLRNRLSDIPLLVNSFLEEFGKKYQKKRTLSEQALEKLCLYDWPGNIRELKHKIENAFILSSNEVIEEVTLNFRKDESSVSGLYGQLEDVEKDKIARSLDKNKGNLSEVARELNISRTTLYKKIKKYGF